MLLRSLNKINPIVNQLSIKLEGNKFIKVLFKGKIVGIKRTLRIGHVYREVIIEGISLKGEGEGKFKG